MKEFLKINLSAVLLLSANLAQADNLEEDFVIITRANEQLKKVVCADGDVIDSIETVEIEKSATEIAQAQAASSYYLGKLKEAGQAVGQGALAAGTVVGKWGFRQVVTKGAAVGSASFASDMAINALANTSCLVATFLMGPAPALGIYQGIHIVNSTMNLIPLTRHMKNYVVAQSVLQPVAEFTYDYGPSIVKNTYMAIKKAAITTIDVVKSAAIITTDTVKSAYNIAANVVSKLWSAW